MILATIFDRFQIVFLNYFGRLLRRRAAKMLEHFKRLGGLWEPPLPVPRPLYFATPPVAWAGTRGNDAADILARRGAAAHVIDEAYEARVRSERLFTRAVQSMMMCDIAQARCESQADEII